MQREEWANDPELIGEVVAESREHLSEAEAALLALEGRFELDTIALAFRAIHTIKGSCGLLGLDDVARFAHVAEGLLGMLRAGTLEYGPTTASLALRSIDGLRTCVEGIARHAPRGEQVPLTDEMRTLMRELSDVVSATPVTAPSAPAVAPPAPVVAATEADAVLPVAAVTPPAVASPAAPPPAETSAAQNDGWTRVRTDRLDRLNEMVGELVVAQAMVEKELQVATRASEDTRRTVGRATKIVRELQSSSLALRMVPMRQTFQRLARVARDVGQRTGKPVTFAMKGEDTELDRNMVDRIADPLVHMVRNAIDHGIEDAAVRAQRGKSANGTIRLEASHIGEELVIELSDDGQGVDTTRVRAKAVERGLIAVDAELTREATLALLFVPGFSTREEVSEISGRGVGMDVVKKAIVACRGRVEIATTPGAGSTFTIRLPLSLAITDGILVRVGDERFVVPMQAIRTSFQPRASELSAVAGGGELVRIGDEVIPLFRLHHLFEVDGATYDATRALLVVVDHEHGPAAYLVDEVLSQQQVVCKALGSQVPSVPGIAGGAILGDGRVGLIIDPPGLAQLARQNGSWNSTITRRAS